MADESVTGSKAQRKKLDEMTKCGICTQTFEAPKCLPCTHTFCLKCLESYAVDKNPGKKSSCPTCRQEWKIPENGIQMLPPNIFAETLAQLVKTPDRVSRESSCGVRLENISSRPTHDTNHHKAIEITERYEIIFLESLNKSKIISRRCEKHPKETLVEYCIDCSVLVCQLCLRESHRLHKSEGIEIRADTVRKQLEGAVISIKRLSKEVDHLINKELPESLLEVIAKTESEIHERSIEIRRIVDLHEKHLCEYLVTVKKKRQEELLVEKTETEVYISEKERFLKMSKELQVKGSKADVCSAGTNLMSTVQELLEKYDKMCRKLKSQTVLPVTELVPVSINSNFNLIGKIKVNVIENGPGNDDRPDRHTFSTNCSDDDNPYNDLPFDQAQESYLYSSLEDEMPTDSRNQRSQPQKLNSDTYSLFDGSFRGNATERGLGVDVSTQYSDDDDDDAYDFHIDHSDEFYESPPLEVETPTESRTPQPQPRNLKSDMYSGLKRNSRGVPIVTEIQPSSVSLLDRLSFGKYTEIWRGTVNHGVAVSVKTFTQDAMTEQWIVNSSAFFREAGILEKLSHPNIVKLIGASTLSEPYYVITEFASNGCLDKYLKNKRDTKITNPISLKDVINMARQIADGMRYLETNNCIHRFLAARSIFVGANNSLKLGNFDMAVILKPRHQGRIPTHTDVYELLQSPMKTRAPEVIESQRWSIKSDVWSFGIVIYEMLTYGAEPYPGISDDKFMSSVLTTYDFLCPAGPNIKRLDPKLRSIMESCWKKDPNERPDFRYLFERFRDFFKKPDFAGYRRRPKIIKAFKLKGSISGITICRKELFIIQNDSTIIGAFSASTFKENDRILISDSTNTLHRRRRTQNNYKGLQDITSYKRGFLYVSSWQNRVIYQINLATRSVTGRWMIGNGDPTTLAVAQHGNLLVSCANEGKVFEYTSDGKLVHEISFGCDGEGPLHTLHFKTERFVVCHGRREAARASEGVTIIGKSGNVIPEVKPLDLSRPCHLAIDSNNNVLIAARGYNRLTLWNPAKDSKRVLISSDQETKVPTKIYLRESAGQLLMLFRDNTLLIYQVRSTESNAVAEDDDEYSSYAMPFSRSRPLLPTEFLSESVSQTCDPDEDEYEELPSDISETS